MSDKDIGPDGSIVQRHERHMQELRAIHAVQGRPANAGADEYMRGLFNGLELALSMFEDRRPRYRRAPEPMTKTELESAERDRIAALLAPVPGQQTIEGETSVTPLSEADLAERQAFGRVRVGPRP